MPSAGAVMVGVGGTLFTVTDATSVEDRPAALVTVSRAANVLTPAAVYVWEGLAWVEVVPSPKSHR